MHPSTIFVYAGLHFTLHSDGFLATRVIACPRPACCRRTHSSVFNIKLKITLKKQSVTIYMLHNSKYQPINFD
jgi:hypothetical protein